MRDRFYKYQIKRRLGSGGMGEVYLAYDTVKHREVALKLVPDDQDSDAQEAIQAEKKGAELQASLMPYSDHVPKIYEYQIRDGYLYIDMEFVDGDDLAQLIFSNPPPYYQIIDIGIQLCEVLQVAHSHEAPIDGQPIKGIAHGDIKPKNIRINKQGQVKLLDYGIAKALSLTRNLTHSAFGSTEYCSPERLNDGELSPAADLWALGAVLYEAVSRRKPFVASTARGVEKLICSGKPPLPLPDHCPKGLREIIFKALKFNKSERFQSAVEFQAALEQLGQGATRKIPKPQGVQNQPPRVTPPNGPSNPVTPPTTPSPDPASTARKKWVVSVVAVIVVMAILLGGLGVNEYKVRADTLELSKDATAAQVVHLSDLAALERRYKELSKRGFIDWGLVSIRERFKSGLMGIADRAINDYRLDKPKLGKPEWIEASDSMKKIIEYFPNDSTAKAKAHYFDGLISLSVAREEKRKGGDGTSNFKEAIRHFNDATLLLKDWPDPHLGLAMLYSYGMIDVRAASDEIAKLRAMGFDFGESREHAMKADALRMSANELYIRAKKRTPLEPSELQSIRQMYQEALDHYAEIPDFSANAKKELGDISSRLREIDAKISALEYQQ